MTAVNFALRQGGEPDRGTESFVTNLRGIGRMGGFARAMPRARFALPTDCQSG
jgi:hypothetical protein